MNAFTGQKTVFCRLPASDAERQRLDEQLFAHPRIRYLNPEDELEQARRQFGQLIPDLKFKRFDMRAYQQFDQTLYGPQLPVALAVRASISLPTFFEPLKLFRRSDGVGSKEFDLFLDGGVDDNFSLSVASEKALGGCTHLLGVSLGNLGYRLPDASAVDGAPAILVHTINYMGDALTDAQRDATDLRAAVTIINAKTELEGDLTETDKIERLVMEGQQIARDFKQTMLKRSGAGTGQAVADGPLSAGQLFGKPGVQQIYLSKAARAGTEQFLSFKSGQVLPEPPKVEDIVGAIPELFSQQPTGFMPRLWGVGYVALFALLFGGVTLIAELLELLFGRGRRGQSGSLLRRLTLTVVAVLGLRVAAYKVWHDTQQKDVQ